MAEQVIATVVGPGTVIRGEVRCAGDLVVHGRIEGAVSCGGALRLEPGGAIEAEVRARSAFLAGRLRGDVSVVEEAELAASCRMLGDLRAARVTIAPGAAVRGRVELGDVGTDEEAAWAAFDDAPAEAALVAPGITPSHVEPESSSAADAGPEVTVEPAADAGPEVAVEPVAEAGPDATVEPVAEAGPEATVEPVADAGPPEDWDGVWRLDDRMPVYAPVQAEPAAPASDRDPPPIPASALALGVRSTIVIKR